MENFFSAVQRYAIWILLAALAGAALCLSYTFDNLRINTDTANMIDAEVPFRQNWEKYRHEFPLGIDSLLLVIDAPGPEAAERAARMIATSLRGKPALFEEVYRPGAGVFFEHNALLYLELPELEELADRLINVQPLLGRLSQNPSIDMFADTLSLVLTGDDIDLDAELLPVLEELSRSFAAALTERRYAMSWQRLLGPDDDERNAGRSYLFLKLRMDFGALLAAEPAIRAVRDAVAEHDLVASRGIRVRITGDAALAHEELLSAMRGAQIAGVLALVMVTGVLFIGLGSVWLVLASLVTLLVGLIATAGFATVAVGHLNLISIAFAVLYIGLGVDYAIHVCLRYRELLGRGQSKAPAIRDAVMSVSGSLLICTLTTATAFYVFLPTAFAGVAELGLISGTGMFINLALNLILLPALLALLPPPRPWDSTALRGQGAGLADFPRRHSALIIGGALVAAVTAGFLMPQVHFDRNTLNLRDPDSESVATIRELMADSDTSPISIDMLVADMQSGRAQLAALEALPSVAAVVSLADFIPDADEQKLLILDELSLTFGADLGLQAADTDLQFTDTLPALERLQVSLEHVDADVGAPLAQQARQLALQLGAYVQQLRASEPAAQRQRLQRLHDSLLSNLPRSLERLQRALQPETGGSVMPPDDLRKRWISARGMHRVNIQPADDIDQGDELRRFVEAVQSIAPTATGEPIIMLRAGDAVVQAFQQAFTWALVLITGLLLILLRSLIATLYIITPLVLAAALSLAALVLLDAPLNFANVIALPLLFGIGVDNGIHMVQRARQTHHPEDNPLRTSTARAILLSGITTICGFGNLLISPHPGTASMGLLLTIGTTTTLVATLIVLPALLAKWPPPRHV